MPQNILEERYIIAKVFIHYVDLLNIQTKYVYLQGGDCNENF